MSIYKPCSGTGLPPALTPLALLPLGVCVGGATDALLDDELAPLLGLGVGVPFFTTVA
jgi:hypothetical protein